MNPLIPFVNKTVITRDEDGNVQRAVVTRIIEDSNALDGNETRCQIEWEDDVAIVNDSDEMTLEKTADDWFAIDDVMFGTVEFKLA